MKVSEIIKKIENNEITIDEINALKNIELDVPISTLEELSIKYNVGQMAEKILMNSLYGALDNKYFILNKRDLSGSITFIGRFMNQFVAKKVNELLKNIFGKYNEEYKKREYIIYMDTDSFYFSLEPFALMIENKMKKNYYDMNEEEKLIFLQKMLDFIKKFINPTADKAIKEIQTILGVTEPGFMGFKVEKINEKGIWVAKKRYALKTIWNEGKILIKKPKLSVTGLEIVRSSTPDFVIEKLQEALNIILDKDEKSLQDFVEKVKKEFFKIADKNPELIAKTSSVNNLNYKKDSKGYYRINEDGRRIACPINSRAAITYNDYVNKYGLWDIYPLIQEGDKIKFVMLKLPNETNQNVFGFIDEGILFENNLVKYIDKDEMFKTNFLQPLKLIAEAVDYKFEKENKIDLDEWF
jgi:DNA polymerase elongation subunit (family B)